MPTLLPAERIGELGDAGPEVGRRVGRRADLPVDTAERERRQRVGKTGALRDAWQADALRRRRRQARRRSGDGAARVAEAHFVEGARPVGRPVARRQRPRGRVLRPQDAAGDTAPIRIRRHRDELLGKARQPCEDGVAARAEMVIAAQRELILVHRLVGGPPEIVGGAGTGRHRETARAGSRHRIPSRFRNRVVRERRADVVDGGRRVVDHRHAPGDRLGEDPLPLKSGRHRGNHRAGDRLPLALVVDEEERRVPADRPAEHAAELIAAILRLYRIGRLEIVARVQ